MPQSETAPSRRNIGRYVLYSEIAAGGMATVHLGRLLGPGGFSRTVAIKRLHPQFAKDPEFVSMFLDEARLAGRIRHPNVASVLDVVALEGELFLVMEYVLGESLSHLLRSAVERDQNVPLPIAVGIVSGALRGLHAAHEATSESGELLSLVHRDVSPHNVLVGTDGVPRVVDFGVAKAANRAQTTRQGQLKGKLSYMSPEQVRRHPIDRRTDVYAAAVVMWETVVGRRLFYGEDTAAIVNEILNGTVPSTSEYREGVPSALEEVIQRGLARDLAERYASARDMALALEDALAPASAAKIGDWVEATARDTLRQREQSLAQVESHSVERDSLPDDDGSDPRSQPITYGNLETARVSSRPDSETGVTVVDGNARRSGSGPTLVPEVTPARASEPPWRRVALMGFALGILVAAAGAALWLGHGQSPQSQDDPAGPPEGTHPSGTAPSAPAQGPDRQQLQKPAPEPGSAGAGARSPSVGRSADAGEVSKQDSHRSPAPSKRGKGVKRSHPDSPPPVEPGKPSTGIDFDDLTRQ